MKFVKDQQHTVSNKYEIDYEPLSKFTPVDKFTNGENYSVVQYKNTETKSGHVNSKNSKNWSYVLSDTQLSNLLNTPENNYNKDLNLKNYIYLVKPGFFEHLKKYGSRHELISLSDFKSQTLENFFVEDVFKKANEKGLEFVEAVENSFDINIWKNAKGEMYCEPFLFDYMAGYLDNKNYKLDKLVEHLMKRDDVAFITDSQSVLCYDKKILHCPLAGSEKDIDKIISNIPHYNVHDERDETIGLIYYPKTEDLIKLIEWAKENDSSKTTFDKDVFIVNEILGAKSFVNSPLKEKETVKRKYIKK